MEYYEILGLDKNCSEKDIKKAYHKLARENHPDKAKMEKKKKLQKNFNKLEKHMKFYLILKKERFMIYKEKKV